MVAELQQECKATRNLKSHTVTIPYILFESQSYNTLHFIRKRFLTSICFQKQKRRQIKPGLFYAFVNVHYVNVNPSIFDVIGRLNTTEYQ